MKRAAVTSIVAACAFSAGLTAQPQKPSAAAGTILKNRAPVSKEILKVHLPKAQEGDLSNSVHLIVVEDHRAPQATFQMIIEGAGGYYDPPSSPGLASFTAALMREGTTTKTSEQISEQLDRLAASVSVSTGMSTPFANLSGSGLTNNLDTVLALMADVLTHPSFPQAEIDRYKTRTRAGLMQNRALPSFLASERLNAAIFGDHPSARTAATPAALDALTRDQLVEFLRAHYVPDRAILAVAGDITFAQAKTKAETAFASWKKSDRPIDAQAEPTAISGPTVSLVARPNSAQTSLRVGTQSIQRTDPDYEALTVASRILGGVPVGRLFEHLREQKGYTYDARSFFGSSRIRGSWIASTDVRSDVTDAALTDLLAEIAAMRDAPVTDKELEDAKRSIVASFALGLENPNSVLTDYIDRYFYKLPPDYWDRLPERYSAVTIADVQRVAQKYWRPDRLQIVAVGEPAKVEPALKKLGTVQTYDAEGKPIK
jgi:zinc protease